MNKVYCDRCGEVLIDTLSNERRATFGDPEKEGFSWVVHMVIGKLDHSDQIREILIKQQNAKHIPRPSFCHGCICIILDAAVLSFKQEWPLVEGDEEETQ
jgi:hypothetical protein